MNSWGGCYCRSFFPDANGQLKIEIKTYFSELPSVKAYI